MNWDIYIFVAFCVFMLLVGIRMRQRFFSKKEEEVKCNKNQRPKMSQTDEPLLVREKRIRREKRVRLFTMVQLVVLLGLLVFMSPSLVKDLMLPQDIDWPNFILRCFIFLFTIYIFILGYSKVFARRKKEDGE